MVDGFLPVQTGVSALLTLALVYLTAFQVEIALRNSALRELEIQPILKVSLEKGYVTGKGEIKRVMLKNEGKYPAKMVTVSIISELGLILKNIDRSHLKTRLFQEKELQLWITKTY